MDDDRLAVLAGKGDQAAFEALVVRYRRYIYNIAWKITLNPEDALDVTQDTMERLSLKISRYRATGKFRSWLGTLTANLALDHLRKLGREVSVEPEQLIHHLDRKPDPGFIHPTARIDQEYRRDRIDQAISQLSAQQRAIFLLYMREDLKPKEISEKLGIPAGQVRLQIHRGTRRLQQILNPQPILTSQKDREVS